MPARQNVLRYKLLFLWSRNSPPSVEPIPRQAQSVVLAQISRALGAKQSSPGSESQAGAGAGIQTGRSPARCSVLDQTKKFHQELVSLNLIFFPHFFGLCFVFFLLFLLLLKSAKTFNIQNGAVVVFGVFFRGRVWIGVMSRESVWIFR